MGSTKGDRADGLEESTYLFFMVGFLASLLLELFVVGYDGLVHASLPVIFAIPVAAGFAGIGVVRAARRYAGEPGLRAAHGAARGMYAGLILAGLALRAFRLWEHALWLAPAMMAAGGLAGLARGRAGSAEHRPAGVPPGTIEKRDRPA